MGGYEVLMDDMVGIVLALEIGLFICELAFFEMVEEAVVRHDVRWVKRALYSLSLFLIYDRHVYFL